MNKCIPKLAGSLGSKCLRRFWSEEELPLATLLTNGIKFLAMVLIPAGQHPNIQRPSTQTLLLNPIKIKTYNPKPNKLRVGKE